ncbi:transcriptional regulator [Lentzea sp. NBRC 105346]|uniref:helix-turn-helix domain-containing protein n=1 Tax=Lentzea sp. NBRC 105346 TaxID=3032205 RepID=UPI0024A3D6BB|nr:helix-turn-helix transcriptional regulator [Lentzea sp. NBRC 105346]GLZ35500.1 transcriptional regulator [Lentzea sp. NBRC 105346]
MTCIPSTAYSRDLGDELRRLRETHTKFTGRWMGHLVGWDQSKISNVENGKVRASEIDLVQYLTACGKDREFIDDFLNRYRNAFDSYFVQVPENLRTMSMAEATANKITGFYMVAIPGLLQTEDYARELFRCRNGVPLDKIERAVRFRMDRQAILQRHDRPACTFFVHELALRMRVGGHRLMEEQYCRLMHHTHSIRIVPLSSGPAGALNASYVLWQYEKANPVAFSESDLAKVFAQDEAAINRCKAIFERLDTVALGEGQSRSLLTDLVSRSREGLNATGLRLA